jgi:hypothetical protein
MLNLNGSPVTGESQTTVVTPETEAEKADRAEKARKARAEKSAARKESYAGLKALKAELDTKGWYGQLSQASQAWFTKELGNDPEKPNKGGGFGGQTVFTTVFGNEAKVGDSRTLMEVFRATKGKGTDMMTMYLKRWAEKGIKVDYTFNDADPFASTYTIKELPAA